MGKRTCSVEACGRPHKARGWCQWHYVRWRRHGDVSDPRPILEERFWRHVQKTGACWLWVGARDPDGYGKFGVDGRTTRAHRWSYEHFVGPIPDGMPLDHKCWNPPCVNPAHLQVATNQQNQQNRSGPNSDGTSGVRGVSWHPGRQRYEVQVAVNGRRRFGGRFKLLPDAEAAAIALRNQVMTNNLADR